MQAKVPEKTARRIAVIVGSGGTSRRLLDLLPMLLGRDRAVEMQGIFLEEAESLNAAELPFVQELCRVTFSLREFNRDQFERALALRMRSAQRALSVLARRAGVVHSFRNVRGSATQLLLEAAASADIMVFEPSRRMSHSMPENTRIPRSFAFSFLTRLANATTRFSSSPLAIARALEWSVMAMYS